MQDPTLINRRHFLATQSMSLGSVALAWLLAQPFITAPIVGANSIQQLQSSLAAVDLQLTPDQVTKLDQASMGQ